MEVTLRKASALEQALLVAARSLPLTKTVAVSIYGGKKVAEEVQTAQDKLSANIERAVALTKAAYKIRQNIGDVNATSGISTLLTEKATLDATEKLLTGLVGAVSTPDVYGQDEEAVSVVSTAQARLDAMIARAATSDRSYGMESVSVAVIGDELTAKVQDQLTSLRLRKVAISDELLLLNMSRKVTLSTEAVSLLKEFKLI
jgi:hypothetical protein